MQKITILIPVYNESKSLLEILKKVESVDFEMEKEIILIDDNSNDGTKRLYKNIPHKVLFQTTNQGKGAALKAGIKEANGNVIIIQDADLEYNPEDYKKIVELIKKDQADVVYGSRLANRKNNKNFLVLSFIANSLLSFMTRLLYRTVVTDMETCYKAFRADILKKIKIESKRFDFEPEITAKILKLGIRYKEVPISYNGRAFSDGKKIGWKDGFQAIYTLVKYRFKN